LKLIRCLSSNLYPTCFGHHYAHHQESKTMWCSALFVLAVVVWSWVASCVHCVKVTVTVENSNLHTVHTACDPAPHNHSQHNQRRTPYEVAHSLVLLMMGIMMPKTRRDTSLIINMRLVAFCRFLSLHATNIFCSNFLFMNKCLFIT